MGYPGHETESICKRMLDGGISKKLRASALLAPAYLPPAWLGYVVVIANVGIRGISDVVRVTSVGIVRWFFFIFIWVQLPCNRTNDFILRLFACVHGRIPNGSTDCRPNSGSD